MAVADVRALAEQLGCASRAYGLPGAALSTGCLETVQQLSRLFREMLPREMAEESIFQNLLAILMKTSSEIELACKDSCESVNVDMDLLLIAECFRCLRNACVRCAKNQHIIRNLQFIDVSVHLIQLLHGLENEQELLLTAFRCSLQFLGNLAAGNGDSQNSIWKCAFPDLFLTCLNHHDVKIIAYCCMVLFTCLNSEKVRELLEQKNLNVALAVLKVYRKQLESEWSFLIVTDHLLKCPELVKAMYAKLSNQERITLLELIMAKVSEKNEVTSEELAGLLKQADFLASCFQEKCQTVLRLTSAAKNEDEEALVTIRLLDVLCEMTSNNRQLEHLQTCPGLLETAVDILQLTHLAGKQATNVFTATHSVTGEGEISHPAVGFKSHLIRLIGNLCYKNKENQDKVYLLDGIPLILDNCSIDDNNPFVNQWAVYAIRNLTERNKRNQALIARMEQQGLADNSILENMGLEIEKRDEKLLLKSKKKPSSGTTK
ncbi:PREDICTED: ataxin-10 isoform X1 [Crocodylus porosus]|uniref:Ataxin-10 n=2 Tax=Crocodylus porosus TaxID=8502 RepID=A0A7M4E0C9_CROPO|nr:PREDICTED: ataxin-10 isoform X1 [Crocodylus porosus]